MGRNCIDNTDLFFRIKETYIQRDGRQCREVCETEKSGASGKRCSLCLGRWLCSISPFYFFKKALKPRVFTTVPTAIVTADTRASVSLGRSCMYFLASRIAELRIGFHLVLHQFAGTSKPSKSSPVKSAFSILRNPWKGRLSKHHQVTPHASILAMTEPD